MRAITGLACALILGLGCAHTVGLKVNGRPSEYLKARVVKAEGAFRVSVDLPTGTWKATLVNEQLPLWIEAQEARSMACWRAPLDRMRQDRPFLLELRSEEAGSPVIVMELQPNQPGVGFLEGVVTVIYKVLGSNRQTYY